MLSNVFYMATQLNKQRKINSVEMLQFSLTIDFASLPNGLVFRSTSIISMVFER